MHICRVQTNNREHACWIGLNSRGRRRRKTHEEIKREFIKVSL